jgi:branched-chain amino acid transport system permease protein
MVLGGLGSIWGALVGGLLLGILQSLAIHFAGADYLKLIIWGFLFLLIILRPEGLFGGTKLSKGKF